jgi:Protein of unknown function (DUF1800)
MIMYQNNAHKSKVTVSALAICGITAGAALSATRLFAAPVDKTKSSVTAKADKNPERNTEKNDVDRDNASRNAANSRSLTEDEKIVHILNRLAFGPRPGDVQKVKAVGIQAYLDQQLTPEHIDDAVVQQKLTAYAMLQMNDEQLFSMFQARTLAYTRLRQVRKQLVGKSTQANGGANMAAMSDAGTDAATAQKARQNVLAMADPQKRQELMAARQELMQTALPIAQAQSIAIQNTSFETIQNASGTWSLGNIPGWPFTGLVSTYNPGNKISVPVPDGTEVAAVGASHLASIAQQLTTSVVAGESYTLTVDVGRRNDVIGVGDSISLFAGGVVSGGSNVGGTLLGSSIVNPPLGGFSIATVNFTDPLVGGPTGLFSIVLANASPSSFQVEFDNVRLNRIGSITAVPEPSTYAFFATSVLTGAAFLRRRKQARKAA